MKLLLVQVAFVGFSNIVFAQNSWFKLDNKLYYPRSIYFTDANTGYSVGGSDTIKNTTDGGITWNAVSSGCNKGLLYIYFVNSLIGFAVGANGIILKTTDAGLTWSVKQSGISSRSLFAIWFVNQNIGYVGGGDMYESILLKTIDGGNTWTSLNAGLNTPCNTIFFINQNTGYIGTLGIKKTTNGGDTWSTQIVGPVRTNSIYFVDSNVGYAVGCDNSISTHRSLFKTINGGLTWQHIDIGGSLGEFFTIFFTSANTGYIGGDHGVIYETNDGNNWVEKTFGVYGFSQIFFPTINTGYAISNSLYKNLPTPVLTIVSPNAYSKLHQGNQTVIKWNTQNYNPYFNVKLEYSTDGGGTYQTIVNGVINSGAYLWTVVGNSSPNCLIRITGVNYPEISSTSQPFTIDVVTVPYKNIKYFDNVVSSNLNPNNYIQVNKPLRFKLQAQNNFIQNLLTLKGSIRTSSPYITVTDSMGTFNNILQGQTAWSFDEYEIEIGNEFPPDGQVEFIFTMRDEIVTTQSWISNFWIPFSQLSRVLFNDDTFYDSQGNGNKILETNETGELAPILKNNSAFIFNTITGQLTSSEPSVTIWNNINGATQLVMDTYSFPNMSSQTDNCTPQWDYVFTKSAGNSSPVLSLVITTMANNVNTKYNLPFAFSSGIPPPGNNQLITATGSASYSRLEFYQNVIPNSENPQNLIGPGRKIRFKLQASNSTNRNLFALYGKISTSVPGVVITDSLASFNNVASGAKGWSIDEYEVIVPQSLPPNAEIAFNLTLKDPFIASGSWASSFKIPFLQFALVVIDDDNNPDSNGDNDDIAEPGETVEIIPLIKNLSTTTFYTASGHLTTPVDYISIWNNHQGASGLVYDTYPYNVFNNVSTPITPNSDNIMPEQDFVFDHNGPGIYTLDFNMIISSFMNAVEGASWDVGGIRMAHAIPFILNQGQPSPLISVISPNGGESWQQGTTHTVTWSDNIIQNVKIDLYKTGVYYQQITSSTLSTGTFSWTIPANLQPASDYGIRISSIATSDGNDFSNGNFSVITSVPANRTLQNMTLVNGTGNCFDASQIVTIAGNGTTFNVQNGASANLIAGQKIRFLPGAKTFQGSYLHGYITTNSQYCNLVPPLNLPLGSMTIANGQNYCFNAAQLIETGGNGNTFSVQIGGNVHLIAGQAVHMYPTTVAASGAFLHAYISTDGVFCSNPKSLINTNDEDVNSEAEKEITLSLNKFFKVYPNPTTGNFILELNGDIPLDNVTVDIYGIWGEKVLTETLNGEHKHEFSLSDRPSGVYFIRVITGDKAETVKIIKQ